MKLLIGYYLSTSDLNEITHSGKHIKLRKYCCSEGENETLQKATHLHENGFSLFD